MRYQSDTTKKGEYLVAWIETQREKAIRVRLDNMAAKLRGEPDYDAKGKTQSQSRRIRDCSPRLSTLWVGQVQLPTDRLNSSPAGAGGGRIEVTTMEEAKVVADKRKENLDRQEDGSLSRV